MEHKKRTGDKQKITRIAVLCSIAVLIVVAGVLIGGRLSNIIFDQDDLFLTATPAPSVEPGATTRTDQVTVPDAEVSSALPTTEPTPTVDPYAELLSQADTSMMQNIVNVLVIGVDYEDARVTGEIKGKGGNAFHSDVMMLVAVNFDQQRVDLISIPRDTYGKIPGVEGIYKLNASLNCGTDGSNYGLYAQNGEGFLKVCETAEWMLGGIPVDYYYAVTMPAVKDLIDAIGGLDYEIEGYYDIGKRFYEPGLQHMDGQAVLDYLRVRKKSKYTKKWTISTSDTNRVKRQKNMLQAIFSKMKAENQIANIPALLSAFDGQLFTNCTASQTAALAAFAYKLDSANIGMHSFSGSSATLFHWNFIFTDQSNRTDIIKQVYGVDTSGYSQYTLKYARYRWASMLEKEYSRLCEPLTEFVQAKIDEDNLLPEFTPEPSVSPSPEPSESPSESPSQAPSDPPATDVPSSDPAGVGWHAGDDAFTVSRLAANGLRRDDDPVQTRQYSPEQRQQFADYLTCLDELESIKESADKEAKKARNGNSNSLSSAASSYLNKLAELQEKAIALAATFGYSKDGFSVPCTPFTTYKGNSAWSLNFWNDKDVNEISVNFN